MPLYCDDGSPPVFFIFLLYAVWNSNGDGSHNKIKAIRETLSTCIGYKTNEIHNILYHGKLNPTTYIW